MVKVYCILIEDRHSDVEVLVRSDREKALLEAKEMALEYDRFNEYEEHPLTQDMIKDGWHYYATYSCEGDSIRVVERDVS